MKECTKLLCGCVIFGWRRWWYASAKFGWGIVQKKYGNTHMHTEYLPKVKRQAQSTSFLDRWSFRTHMHSPDPIFSLGALCPKLFGFPGWLLRSGLGGFSSQLFFGTCRCGSCVAPGMSIEQNGRHSSCTFSGNWFRYLNLMLFILWEASFLLYFLERPRDINVAINVGINVITCHNQCSNGLAAWGSCRNSNSKPWSTCTAGG